MRFLKKAYKKKNSQLRIEKILNNMAALAKLKITQTNVTVNVLTQNVSTLTFAIYAVDGNGNVVNMTNTASYTIFTAIDASGTLLADSYYNNFSSAAQATATNLGKFAINIANLGGAAAFMVEYKY